MKYLILLLCSLFTIQAQSEITVMQVSDYSVSSSEITDNNSLTVWGSSEGESVCTGSTACNSCAMNINKINSCNLKQIGPNIQRVNFLSNLLTIIYLYQILRLPTIILIVFD